MKIRQVQSIRAWQLLNFYFFYFFTINVKK